MTAAGYVPGVTYRSQPPRLELLSDYLQWYASERPDDEAAVSGELRYTYAHLHKEVNRYAAALIAAGVEVGDRIATLSSPNADFLIQFLATSSVGAIWLGLNPRHQPSEYDYVLQDAQPKILFSPARMGQRNYSDELSALKSARNTLDIMVLLDAPEEGKALGDKLMARGDFLALAETVSESQLDERRQQVISRDSALIVYTSGSTGHPKGALISHHGLITCGLNQARYWQASPLRMVNFLPINHIGCVGDISCYLLLAGGTNVFMEQFDPRVSLELMQRERVTAWGGVPTSLQMCLDVPQFENYDLSSVQIVFWSGAAASPDLVRRLQHVCPRLFTSYGMTETVGSVTFTDSDADPEVLSRTIGKPAAEFELRLQKENGQQAEPGEPGEIQVRGDYLMTGYWNRPQETAALFEPDGWMRTGDLAVQQPDGNWQLVGRMREMFKSGGYNIYPREIEQAIERHPAVAMTAVIEVPDPLYQEVGWAFVSLNPGAVLSEPELQVHCRGLLANYKVPKRFFLNNDLPLLPIGKIDKRALRELALSYNDSR